MEDAVIDFSVIEKFFDIKSDPEGLNLAHRLMEMFLLKTPAELSAIREALKNGDLAIARSLAHRVKSLAANLGATRFSSLCLEIEKCSDLNGAEKTLAKLVEEYAGVQCVLRSELDRK